MQAVWSFFLQELDVSLAGQRALRGTEFLLHLPFREKGRFLWLAGVFMCFGTFGGRGMIGFLEVGLGTLVRSGH